MYWEIEKQSSPFDTIIRQWFSLTVETFTECKSNTIFCHAAETIPLFRMPIYHDISCFCNHYYSVRWRRSQTRKQKLPNAEVYFTLHTTSLHTRAHSDINKSTQKASLASSRLTDTRISRHIQYDKRVMHPRKTHWMGRSSCRRNRLSVATDSFRALRYVNTNEDAKWWIKTTTQTKSFRLRFNTLIFILEDLAIISHCSFFYF